MASEIISMAYFLPSVYISAYPPVIAKQRLSKNDTMATNTHATIEELLDASFLLSPCGIKGEQVVLSRTTHYK
jgi:hypothetical protein